MLFKTKIFPSDMAQLIQEDEQAMWTEDEAWELAAYYDETEEEEAVSLDDIRDTWQSFQDIESIEEAYSVPGMEGGTFSQWRTYLRGQTDVLDTENGILVKRF